MSCTHQPEQQPEPAASGPAPLLTPRAALIVLLAVLTGIGAGALTAVAGSHPAQAVLVGAAASAAASTFFNSVIARR